MQPQFWKRIRCEWAVPLKEIVDLRMVDHVGQQKFPESIVYEA